MLHPERAPLLGYVWGDGAFLGTEPRPPVCSAGRSPKAHSWSPCEEGRFWCHFLWGGRPHVLASEDPRLAASLRRSGRTFAQMRPGAYIVVALSPPVDGHCYKVVEAVVPRR